MITFCFWGILSVAALSSVISLTRDIRYIGRWISSFYVRPKAITINIKLAPKSPYRPEQYRFFTWPDFHGNAAKKREKIIL